MTTTEMDLAQDLPQLDATSLVDREQLEARVTDMYTQVARGAAEELHFEIGRPLAERLGYPRDLLNAIPWEAADSFAGVGYALDMAGLRPGDHVLDLGSGSGTDLFCAAVLVGAKGLAQGVDLTPAQVSKARGLRDRAGFTAVRIARGRMEDLPFADGSFDAVVSNGVINLAPDKARVFAEAARVLRPGGRLAIADVVSGRPLKERTRRNIDLWAACIAGAVPGDAYIQAIEAAGLAITDLRCNDYRFRSPRAQQTAETYDVASVSIGAIKPVPGDPRR